MGAHHAPTKEREKNLSSGSTSSTCRNVDVCGHLGLYSLLNGAASATISIKAIIGLPELCCRFEAAHTLWTYCGDRLMPAVCWKSSSSAGSYHWPEHGDDYWIAAVAELTRQSVLGSFN